MLVKRGDARCPCCGVVPRDGYPHSKEVTFSRQAGQVVVRACAQYVGIADDQKGAEKKLERFCWWNDLDPSRK